jgi:mono/diheme cytochrome c family protein
MKRLLALTVAIVTLAGINSHADEAKDNYDKGCAKCHGADGKGDTKMGKKMGIKDLTDAKVQANFTDEKAFKAIKEGVKDGEKTLMKPSEDLKDDQIKAMVTYVRTFKK